MDSRLLEVATRIIGRGQPYALATVVWRERPSSATPGDTAVITEDGVLHGWIGGSCTRSEVVRHARLALRECRPRMLAFGAAPKSCCGAGAGGADGSGGRDEHQTGAGAPDPRREHVIPVPMTCGSEGKVDVHVNPVFPPPELVVVGSSPVGRAVVRLGGALGYSVTGFPDDYLERAAGKPPAPGAPAGEAWHGRRLSDLAELGNRSPGRRLLAVVATMGRDDERAAGRLLPSRPDYLGVVASPRRMAQIRATLAAEGVADVDLGRLHGPAGLDIGARAPEEIALSILAEAVAVVAAIRKRGRDEPEACVAHASEASAADGASRGRQEPRDHPESPAHGKPGTVRKDPQEQPPATATDPICGMTVPADGSRPSTTFQSREYHFCCPGCLARFEEDPSAYAGAP